MVILYFKPILWMLPHKTLPYSPISPQRFHYFPSNSSFQEQALKFVKVLNSCCYIIFKYPREIRGSTQQEKTWYSLAYYCYANKPGKGPAINDH